MAEEINYSEDIDYVLVLNPPTEKDPGSVRGKLIHDILKQNFSKNRIDTLVFDGSINELMKEASALTEKVGNPPKAIIIMDVLPAERKSFTEQVINNIYHNYAIPIFIESTSGLLEDITLPIENVHAFTMTRPDIFSDRFALATDMKISKSKTR